MATIQDIAAARVERNKRLKRKELEGSFRAFITYFFPLYENVNFIFKEHHLEIIKKLEDVYNGKCKRLIINIPPGYGKTELVVILFCAWCFAKTKDSRFLHLSYTSDLTAANSVKIKDILKTKEFQELWPMPFSKEINGKEHWKTEHGEFRAKSTGGAVTGFRAGRMGDREDEPLDIEVPEEGDWMDSDDIDDFIESLKGEDGNFHGALIIDDPIKPEDAESDVLRNKMNKRMVSTLKSRIMHEDVPVILIMQRVHDDDPAGFMLGDTKRPEVPGGTGDIFEQLKIEAIRKDKDGNEYALWPRKDSLVYLQNYRKSAPYEFSAQYQQNPVPDDGIFFQKHQFKWYNKDELPEGEDFGASDYATTKDAGDFTESGVFRITPSGDVYAKDWWGGQETSDEWIESQIDLAIAHNVKMWAGETGPIKAAIEPFLKRRLVEREHPMILQWFSHSEKSKEQNARGFQAIVSSGRFYVPRGEPWAQALVEQLCRFPRGKFDDKVDTCSLLAKMINKLWASKALKKEPGKLEKIESEKVTIDEMIRRHKQKNRTKRNNRNERM